MYPDPSDILSYHSYERIFDAFLAQARAEPTAVALSSRYGQCSYQQLEQASAQVAQKVLQQTQGIEQPGAAIKVAMIADRGPALVFGMLGVMRAGGSFLIIDSNYPQARIEAVLDEWQPSLVLDCCCGDISSDLQGLQSEKIKVSSDAQAVQSLFDGEPRDLEAVAVDPESIAYGFFTSGTTGKPKGIVTHHAPLVHFVDWHVQRHGFTGRDRFSLLSGLGHDPVLRDVMTPLSIGATLCIPEQSFILDPARLIRWFTEERISVCHLTPALGELIAIGGDISQCQLSHLRWLYFGGDVLSRKVSGRLRDVAPDASQVNFYGATETPQAMAFFDVPLAWEEGQLPIGAGIADTQLLVVTEKGALANIGERGEILIRTPYLSRGYLKDVDDTSSRFIANPLADANDSDDLCYRTGDYGFYRDDGQVIFIGRMDHQVKIRGFRVEPGEVSSRIEAFDGVSRALVMAREKSDGHKFLVAYYTSAFAMTVEKEELHQYLVKHLPAYEVPQVLVPMERFPLLHNGKIDHKALEAMPLEPMGQHTDQICRDDLDEKTVDIIQGLEEILGCTIPEPDVTFIELGGDSLSFINATLMIEKSIGAAPDQWESVPLSELVAQVSSQNTREKVNDSDRKSGHPLLITIETSVLLRAMSICLVVLWHMEVLFVPATSMLFVLSGVSFARFLAPAIRACGNIKPVVLFILGFGVPTLLWQLVRFTLVGDGWWPQLFMLGTLIPNPDFPLWPYWYLDVLTLSLLFISTVWVVVHRWQERQQTALVSRLDAFQWSIAITLFCFALAVLQVTLDILNGEIAKDSVAPFRWSWLLPLGMAMYYANDAARKLLVSAMTLILCAAIYWSEPLVDLAPLIDPFFIGCVLLVIWIPRVHMLALLKRPILLLASSTLFIYILHWTVLYHMPKTGLPEWPLLQFTLAVGTGIVAQQVWSWGMPKSVRLLRRAWAVVRF